MEFPLNAKSKLFSWWIFEMLSILNNINTAHEYKLSLLLNSSQGIAISQFVLLAIGRKTTEAVLQL